jgi:hypothetical protein
MTSQSGMRVGAAFALALLSLAACVFAHKPLPFGQDHSDSGHALLVHDIDVSQVTYFEVTASSPQYWLAIDAPHSASLSLSIGVPVIDRYRSFRPALAVLGPGLPAVGLPFSVPQGYGGEILATDSVANPSVFHEPFTGTDSWALRDDKLTLKSPGRYYIVLFSPRGETGKFWAAIGERESFGLTDFLNLPTVVKEVRAFHEVPGRPEWLDTAGWIVFSAMALVFFLVFGT